MILTIFKKPYGKISNTLENAINQGLLPIQFKEYRQRKFATFDCETLESEHDADDVDGVLKICSIGFASNISNTDRFFVRSSSHFSAGSVVVTEFLDHLFNVETQFYESIPDEIKTALKQLDERVKTKFSSERSEIQNLLYNLRKYTEFPVFGFNNGKHITCLVNPYDMNHIIWSIFYDQSNVLNYYYF